LKKTPVKIRTIYADTDAMGIVYHTNYIRWFEIGRNELFRELGIVYKDLELLGFNLPLTQAYEKLVEGRMIADAIAILGSLNIVVGELDR